MKELQQLRPSGPAGELQETVRRFRPWFHNLHLPDGTETAPDHPLGDFPSYKWREISAALPENLSGWEALDIGCNAGFYCFELALRGARVTGIDMNPHYLAQARWAASQFGLADVVEFRQMQVYELARMNKVYDLVLFLGVFYHLRYPLPLLLCQIKGGGRMLLVIIFKEYLPGNDFQGNDFQVCQD